MFENIFSVSFLLVMLDQQKNQLICTSGIYNSSLEGISWAQMSVLVPASTIHAHIIPLGHDHLDSGAGKWCIRSVQCKSLIHN